MKRIIIAALVSCLIACALALAGCSAEGGANGPSPAEANEAAFAGSWEFTTLEENGSPIEASQVELFKSLGLTVALQLNEDGSASLDAFGDVQAGTWKTLSATEAELEIGSAPIALSLEDGTLTLNSGTSLISFQRIEEPESA